MSFTAACRPPGALRDHPAVDPQPGSPDWLLPGIRLVLALTMPTGAMVFTAFSSMGVPVSFSGSCTSAP